MVRRFRDRHRLVDVWGFFRETSRYGWRVENEMTDYIVKAATAWFLGFFPYFEIYLAVPAAIGMRLDYFSAVFWPVFGNFMAVPVVLVFYKQLMRIGRLRNWLEKRTSSEKYRGYMNRYGPLFVLLMTPVVGVWVIAAMARVGGMNRTKLLVSSLVSIIVYAIAIAVLVAVGVDFAAR